MHEKHAGAKTKLTDKGEDFVSLGWRTCADDRADEHFKTGMVPQPLQAFLQVVKNFLRRFICLNPIDGKLHSLQPGFVECFNQLWP